MIFFCGRAVACWLERLSACGWALHCLHDNVAMDRVREAVLTAVIDNRYSLSSASHMIGEDAQFLARYLYDHVPDSLPNELLGKLADVLGLPVYALKP